MKAIKRMGRKLCSAALLPAWVCGLAFAQPTNAEVIEEPGNAAGTAALCHLAAREQENRLKIPRDLLSAIAITESGRWSKPAARTLAWPWTVMAEGKGRYFDTKLEAVAEVELLLSQGVKNIDVGCMQINLHHHWWAFETLDQAFDPATNAKYAADFLSDKRRESRNWVMAAGRYHSKTPEHFNRYRKKVLEHWQGLKQSPVDFAALAPDPSERKDAPVKETTVASSKEAAERRYKSLTPIDNKLTSRLNARFQEQRQRSRDIRTGTQLRRSANPDLARWQDDRNRDVRLQRVIAERKASLRHKRKSRIDALTKEAPRDVRFSIKRKQQLKQWRRTGLLRGDS